MSCRLQWSVDYASAWHFATQQHWRTIFLRPSPHSFARGTWDIQKYPNYWAYQLWKVISTASTTSVPSVQNLATTLYAWLGAEIAVKSLFLMTLDGHLRYILFHDSISVAPLGMFYQMRRQILFCTCNASLDADNVFLFGSWWLLKLLVFLFLFCFGFFVVVVVVLGVVDISLICQLKISNSKIFQRKYMQVKTCIRTAQYSTFVFIYYLFHH